MNIIKNHTAFFDGICNLCNGGVRFIIKHNKKKNIHFVSLQSELSQKFLTQNNRDIQDFNTMIYLSEGIIYERSSAILRIIKELDFPYRLFYVSVLIPPFIRDAIYNVIAQKRYDLFGKKDSCMIPSDELKERFYE